MDDKQDDYNDRINNGTLLEVPQAQQIIMGEFVISSNGNEVTIGEGHWQSDANGKVSTSSGTFIFNQSSAPDPEATDFDATEMTLGLSGSDQKGFNMLPVQGEQRLRIRVSYEGVYFANYAQDVQFGVYVYRNNNNYLETQD